VVVFSLLFISSAFASSRTLYADMASAVGLAIMVGQVPAMWNVLASDAVAHLCKHRPIPKNEQISH
jgi:hypothetical protein